MRHTDRELTNFMYNVAWLRKHNGISKKKMANLLGIGIWSINKIENGELPMRLSVEVLFNIMRHFGIRPYELFRQRLDDHSTDK